MINLVERYNLRGTAPKIENHGMNWDPGAKVYQLPADAGSQTPHPTPPPEAGGGDPKVGAGVNDIPDDANTTRLVLLSNNEQTRQGFLSTFASLANWQGKAIAQAYPPQNWAVSKLYPMPQDPTLYCVDGDGTKRSCTKGNVALASTTIASVLDRAQKLRDAPGSDPSTAPDLSKDQPKPSSPGVAGVDLVETDWNNLSDQDHAALGILGAAAAGLTLQAIRRRNQARAN